jgi:phosphoserine phosphatase
MTSPAPAAAEITTLVAVDLDRTLIYSKSALGLSESSLIPLRCVEIYQDSEQSFMTEAATLLLAELIGRAVVVPVTTRSRAQFQRVQLRGGPTHFAITTNGARLIVDGHEDHEWSSAVRARVKADCAPLSDVEAMLQDEQRAPTGRPWIERVRRAEDAFAYVIIRRDLISQDDLDRIRDWCAHVGWTVSVQGSKLYCVPAPLTKTAAIAEIARRSGAARILAAGDSLLDAGMLEAADAGIRPSHGELGAAGWSSEHVTVTESAGIIAGEQILQWLLSQLTRAAGGLVVGAQRRDDLG